MLPGLLMMALAIALALAAWALGQTMPNGPGPQQPNL